MSLANFTCSAMDCLGLVGRIIVGTGGASSGSGVVGVSCAGSGLVVAGIAVGFAVACSAAA